MKNISVKLMVIFGVFLYSVTPMFAAETGVTINVNASSFIRTIPETMFGGNLTA